MSEYLTLQLDPTGGDDTQRLSAAIRSLTFPKNAHKFGTIKLSGNYRVSQPIVLGDWSDRYISPPALVGDWSAQIDYVGPQTDDYLVTVTGFKKLGTPRLQGIELNCNSKCRGLLCAGQQSNSSIRDLRIQDHRQVGVDLIDCWQFSADNITTSGKGFGIRSFLGNGQCLRNLSMYGSGLAEEDWPPDTDIFCRRYDGTPLPSLSRVNRRSLLLLDTASSVAMSSVVIQQSKYGEHPLIHVFESRNVRLEDVYLEGSSNLHERILLTGVNRPDPSHFDTGVNNVIDGVYGQDVIRCESLVRFRGYSRNCTVKHIYAKGVGEVVKYEGSQHFGNSVEMITA